MSEKGFLAEAIQLILDKSRPVTVDVDGVSFWSDSHKEVAQDVPQFPALSVNTLSGLADVIKAESEWDGISDALPLLVRVESPNYVSVSSSISYFKNRPVRQILYKAENVNTTFTTGEYPQEQMVIALRSLCQDGMDKEYLLDLISRIDINTGVSITDTGLTQSVVQKVGAQLKDEVPIKPIIRLKPYRTFLEVDQPESEFLLRVTKSGSIQLREADGGAWKLEARRNIKEHLEELLQDEIGAGAVAVML